jgi:hypothetical protein
MTCNDYIEILRSQALVDTLLHVVAAIVAIGAARGLHEKLTDLQASLESVEIGTGKLKIETPHERDRLLVLRVAYAAFWIASIFMVAGVITNATEAYSPLDSTERVELCAKLGGPQ